MYCRNILLRIILDHNEVQFECWGSYEIKDANLSGRDDEKTRHFINELKKCKNVLLHGTVPTNILAKEFGRMDAFLICYDVQKDQSHGTNYHKIIEYLGIGKVIISNNVTTYRDRPELIQMVSERDNNRNLPDLFSKVISDLAVYNEPLLVKTRIDFAKDNTYERQIERIETLLMQLEHNNK